MPKELLNEGRVVGFSAYELYVRHALSIDPNAKVASERGWLSSTIASGTSMLLKIPANTAAGVKDFPLPSTSRLVAANTIIGSFAYGVEAEFSGNWATKITAYNNDLAVPPVSATTSATAPTSTSDAKQNKYQTEEMQYIKIIDGVVYQKGAWKAATAPPSTEPTNLSYKQCVVRLAFCDKITVDTYILLTGFTDLAVVRGVSGLGDSTNPSTNNWQNGEFLGPGKFPWMSKIWFATPGNLTYELKMGLSNDGKKNVVINSDPDSPITTIKVLNNIHTSKSNNFLKINQTLDGGDTDINIDGKALIEDILAPGIGTNIVDSSTDPKNSYGTARKVIKSNLNAPNGSGITIDPLSNRDNKQGAVTQDIKTNIVAGKGVQITDDNSSTKRTIYSNVKPGKGITIDPLSSTTSGTQTYTLNTKAGVGITINDVDDSSSETTGGQRRIRTNITPGDGIEFSYASNNDNDGKAQEISTRLVNGNGTSVNTKDAAETGIKGKSQKIDINTGGSMQVDSSNNLITNLTPGKGISIDNSTGAINTKLVGGQGIAVDNDDGKIYTSIPLDSVRLNTDSNTNGFDYNGASSALTGNSRPEVYKITVSTATQSGTTVANKDKTKSIYMITASTTDSSGAASQRSISKTPSTSINVAGQSISSNKKIRDLNWALLLAALQQNQGIDLLGDRLKSIQDSLLRDSNTGYIEFGIASNPIRLYISSDVPSDTDIPVGSIGIGWGFSS